jgi:hypothetical protein
MEIFFVGALGLKGKSNCFVVEGNLMMERKLFKSSLEGRIHHEFLTLAAAN